MLCGDFINIRTMPQEETFYWLILVGDETHSVHKVTDRNDG